MGEISKRLRRKLSRHAENLPTKEPPRRPGEPLPGNVKDVQMLIDDGLDPIHAVYAYSGFKESGFQSTVKEIVDEPARCVAD